MKKQFIDGKPEITRTNELSRNFAFNTLRTQTNR